MMLDKKQVRAIFFFEFKTVFRTETICNINNASDPGTTNEHECSGGSRSFKKETRALKMRSAVAGHQKLRTIACNHQS